MGDILEARFPIFPRKMQQDNGALEQKPGIFYVYGDGEGVCGRMSVAGEKMCLFGKVVTAPIGPASCDTYRQVWLFYHLSSCYAIDRAICKKRNMLKSADRETGHKIIKCYQPCAVTGWKYLGMPDRRRVAGRK